LVHEGGWLVNTLWLELPAERLEEAFCWPDVASIEVTTQYWDVVTTPWDESSVGTAECPVIALAMLLPACRAPEKDPAPVQAPKAEATAANTREAGGAAGSDARAPPRPRLLR
jgi:hypothetical protein